MSTIKHIPGAYDDLAAKYDALVESLEYFCPAWIARNVHQIEKLPECHVLDLGCGTGLNVKALCQQRTGIRAEGVDASHEMTEIARATGLYQRLSVHDLNKVLPDISTATFDLVMVFSVLQFLSEPRICLAECHRVLKPGGMLWATFRPYEDGDSGTPSRQFPCGEVTKTGRSASEIHHIMRKVGIQVTALEPVVEYVSPNGFPFPCYLLQGRKRYQPSQQLANLEG